VPQLATMDCCGALLWALGGGDADEYVQRRRGSRALVARLKKTLEASSILVSAHARKVKWQF
jgi:hypothetical protein